MSADDNPRTEEILEAWLYALEKGFKQNASIRKATLSQHAIQGLRRIGAKAFHRWLRQLQAQAWAEGAEAAAMTVPEAMWHALELDIPPNPYEGES